MTRTDRYALGEQIELSDDRKLYSECKGHGYWPHINTYISTNTRYMDKKNWKSDYNENTAIITAISVCLSVCLSVPPPLSYTCVHITCRFTREKQVVQRTQRISKSFVHRLSRIVWFLVEFWTGIVFEHGIQKREVYSKWQGQDGKKHAALGSFFHFGIWKMQVVAVESSEWNGT